MKEIKKWIPYYVFMMIIIVVWGVAILFVNKNPSLKIGFATGDKIVMELDKKNSSATDITKTKSMVLVKTEEQTVLKITFLEEEDWQNYLTNTRIEGDSPNIKTYENITYEFVEEDSEEVIVAWINGSRTGMLIRREFISVGKMEELLRTLSFKVIETTQKENYCPSIKEKDEVYEETIDLTEDKKPIKNADWESLEIMLDGVLYTFPYDYKQLQENGWKMVNEADSKIELPVGETSQDVQLVNEKYENGYDNFSITCNFKNNKNQNQLIEECDIYHVSLDAASGMKMLEKYPEVLIANEIGYRSTITAVKNAFGEPQDIYENEYCSILTYSSNGKYVQFVIYDEYGLVSIDIRDKSIATMEEGVEVE